MYNIDELTVRLGDINKEIELLYKEKCSVQEAIKVQKTNMIDEEFAKCDITSNMYIVLFAKDHTNYTLIKTIAVHNVSAENKCINCVEGSYGDSYDGYMYRTDLEHMSFSAFLEHKDRYNMYVCTKEQFNLLQVCLCEHSVTHSNVETCESEINCLASRVIS